MFGPEPVFVEEIVLVGHLSEPVWDAKALHTDGVMLAQHFANRTAQAADDVLIFNRYHRSGFLGGIDEGPGSKGLTDG